MLQFSYLDRAFKPLHSNISTSLIQSTQGEIRRLGYFASVKFDPAKRAPFEPLLRAMGSLFRQIFSESDVNSVYHNIIRGNVRAFWPTLCSMLDLPENLIFWEAQYPTRSSNVGFQQGSNKSLRPEMKESSSTTSGQSSNHGVHLTSDFLRGASNTRPMKFMNIFLEVLRVLSSNKLICLCLDDLQNADEESLDLVYNIMSRKLGVALIVSYLLILEAISSTDIFYRSPAARRSCYQAVSGLYSITEV